MTLLQLLAALLPVVSVFLLLRATLWDRSTEPAPMALLVALAIGIGFAVSSCTFFLSLLLFDGARLGVIAIDLALLLLAAVAAWRRPGRPQARVPHPSSPRDRLLVAAVLAAALTGAIAFFINTLEDPHGQWDAWMTWNLRARALVRAGPAWRTLFAPPTVHGDYPLMVPAAVARIWVYGGAEDSEGQNSRADGLGDNRLEGRGGRRVLGKDHAGHNRRHGRGDRYGCRQRPQRRWSGGLRRVVGGGPCRQAAPG
jgi:hypothetical protein